jgi:hypothetical protein
LGASLANLDAPSALEGQRDLIIKGQQAPIAQHFKKARENLVHQASLSPGGLDNPAFKAQLRELESDEANAMLQVESAFGLELGRTGDQLTMNKIQQVLGQIPGAFGRSSALRGEVGDLQREANQQTERMEGRVQDVEDRKTDADLRGLQLALNALGLPQGDLAGTNAGLSDVAATAGANNANLSKNILALFQSPLLQGLLNGGGGGS